MFSGHRFSGAAMALAVLAVGACGSGGLKADAGPDISVGVGGSPTFDGCASEGEPTLYNWTIVEAPDEMAGDAGKVIQWNDPGCSFTLEASMLAQEVGTWVIDLTVIDEEGDSSSDTFAIEVTP